MLEWNLENGVSLVRKATGVLVGQVNLKLVVADSLNVVNRVEELARN